MEKRSDNLIQAAGAAVPGKQGFDHLIVGAGFAGSVLAERLASDGQTQVLIVDKRPHIGGNAYDRYDDSGVLIHPYGPHIFHTNSADIFEYLSRFTAWRPYQHRVLASVDGQRVPLPINLDTINQLYGLQLTSFEMETWLESVAEKRDEIRNSEDVIVNKVGRELYNKFFRGYTRKQWALDPSELDASVTARVPTRTNRDDRYFTDTYQAMPLHGYTRMFERMLAHPNIKVMLNTDYRAIVDLVPWRHMVYSGPVDAFFNFKHGKLPYRSIRFEHRTVAQAEFQPVGTVNYPNDYGYTRISEFKHITGQQHAQTSIVYEYPCAEGDPYYPVPRAQNAALYRLYEAEAEALDNVSFVGRLATYKYYNMDQVVGQSLATYKRICQRSAEAASKPAGAALARAPSSVVA
ncbi:UDP-galactopyranose mutase [Rubrivivax sp. RP6-9]|uniref:UDP-galactopyranose mutase n=1 Tax=Rubrivivax sp. RP6-9 TaxID=3415750 RepID=UPI003CC65AE9